MLVDSAPSNFLVLLPNYEFLNLYRKLFMCTLIHPSLAETSFFVVFWLPFFVHVKKMNEFLLSFRALLVCLNIRRKEALNRFNGKYYYATDVHPLASMLNTLYS